jgi:hypothetical protein
VSKAIITGCVTNHGATTGHLELKTGVVEAVITAGESPPHGHQAIDQVADPVSSTGLLLDAPPPPEKVDGTAALAMPTW